MSEIFSQLRTVVNDDGTEYQSLMFICPGCQFEPHRSSGLHMLPVSGNVLHGPRWDFDNNFVAPTLSPSILTKYVYGEEKRELVCHSFLRNGYFEFLSDCTHPLAGQTMKMPPLPDWAIR